MTNDAEAITTGISQMLSSALTAAFTICAALGFIFSVNYAAALIVLFLTPISIIVSAFIAKKSGRMFSAQLNLQGELSGHIHQMITNQKTVKAFGFEDSSIESFTEINSRLYEAGQKAQFYSSLTQPSSRLVNNFITAVIFVTSAAFALSGNVSVGGILALLSYVSQYTRPINDITSIFTEFQNAVAAAGRVEDILSQNDEQDSEGKLCNVRGDVSMNDVSFSYTPDAPLIEGFNLNVKAGQKAAIVGRTGSGKTTLINLLMRFYRADSGEILIDGFNINEARAESLRGNVSMVLQDTWLFDGTVRENIAYGAEDADEDKIIEAAVACDAHHFISKLENGYDTVLHDGQTRLSAGERQLICIARAMLTDPPLLILDEATSNIDIAAEKRIQNAFAKLYHKGKTTFVVAHRLSTIKEADIIIVMHGGKIAETGTHEQLMQNNGYYAKMYNS